MVSKETMTSFDFDRLIYVLKAKGKTRKYLCEKVVFCSFSNYKQWKKNRRISTDDLYRIAKAFDVDYDWLLGYDYGHKRKPTSSDKNYILDADGYIIPRFKAVTLSQQEKHANNINRKFETWLDSVSVGIDKVSRKKGGLSLAQYKDIEGDFEILMVEVGEFIVNKLIEAKQTAPMTAEQLVKVYALYSADEIKTITKQLGKESLVDFTQAEADKIIANREEG